MTINEYERLLMQEQIRHNKIVSELLHCLKMSQQVCEHKTITEENICCDCGLYIPSGILKT